MVSSKPPDNLQPPSLWEDPGPLSGFPDCTTSPRPLHPLQVDKQVVAVNSSNIIIEQLQRYETTDRRHFDDGRALLSSHLNIQRTVVMKLLKTKPSRIWYAGVLPLEGNTNICQEEDFASNLFFHCRDSQRPPQSVGPSFWLFCGYWTHCIYIQGQLIEFWLQSNNCFQTEQRAALYTKILILCKFVKILKFIKNA